MSIITLIRLLKDRYNCLNGAVRLIKPIDFFILRSNNPPKLTQSQVNAYVDLCLETDMQTANPERMLLLAVFCCTTLGTLQQCSLVAHLSIRYFNLPLFGDLLAFLAQREDFNVTPDIEKYAVGLLFCYLKFDDWHLFSRLASKLLTNPQAVQVVLSSSMIWRRAKLNDSPGRAQLIAVLPSFVKRRIATLAGLVEQNPNNDTDQEEDGGQKKRLRLDLSFAFEVVVRLMEVIQLTDLQGMTILDPLLAKMSAPRMAQFVEDADAVLKRQETNKFKRFFVKICQQVRLPDLSDYATLSQFSEAVRRLLMVFSGQGSTTSEGLLNSLVKPLLTRSPLPGDVSLYTMLVVCGWVTSFKPQLASLMKRFTSRKLAAWIALLVDRDDVVGAKMCIGAFFKLMRPCSPNADPAPLSPFIARIPTENLFDLLSLLHSVINEWNLPPSKTSAPSAQLGRDLIFELLGRENAKDAVKTFEAAQKVFQCLIWLGDGPCMDSFIAVLSATRDGERLAVQLTLSIGNQPELANLSAHHPAGLKVCCALLDYCIEGLERIWKQTDAVVPGYPDVENFLRSSSQSMVLDGFGDRFDEARRFCEELQRSHRVTAQAKESDDKTVRVEIAKVTEETELGEDQQKKLDTLMALRKNLISKGTVTTGTKRSAVQNSTQETKRPKNSTTINLNEN